MDNGNGTATFKWRPDFIGPYSSDGSPYSIGIWANDGVLTVETSVNINVVNKNRKPVLSVIESVEVESGDVIDFNVSAVDPDFEPVSWNVSGLPSAVSFDPDNPSFHWATSLTDTGTYNVVYIASDPQGYADTAYTTIHLDPTALYSLVLDTISDFPGERVLYEIKLDNKFPISSFNLLINYDPTAMALNSVTRLQTRIEEFEYYNVTLNDNGAPGRVRIVGIGDLTGNSTQPLLEAGEGTISSLSLQITSNITYSGMIVPLRFLFIDDEFEDNTLTDTLGNRIEQEAIEYHDGYVYILSLGEVNVGDINLNGIAFEIGDAIYFINYFMDIVHYQLNPLQYANSDINNDGIGGTIGDFVALINIIVEGGASASKIVQVENLHSELNTEITTIGTDINYISTFEVGAVLIEMFSEAGFDESNFELPVLNMNADYVFNGTYAKVLIYSLDGNEMPSGNNHILTLNGVDDVKITSVAMSDSYGRIVDVSYSAKNTPLPEQFDLYQNYPNPFNPDTRIEFDLPEEGNVKLTIYNILGEKVKSIINENLPAGKHSVTWDSRNEDGTSVSSGVYLYRLETEGWQKTRKMLLVK